MMVKKLRIGSGRNWNFFLRFFTDQSTCQRFARTRWTIKQGFVSWFYFAVNVLVPAFFLLFLIWGLTEGMLKWGTIIKQFIIGLMAGSILVIPPHEILHGVAYRILGAKKIRFGADMQQFIFFVTADRFPISGTQLHFLALTPFVVINAIVITVTAIYLPQVTLFSATLLLSHNIMCIGDFAMVNYVLNEKGELYSYDEIEHKKSYFFKRVNDSLL